jgi:hypothetical protein
VQIIYNKVCNIPHKRWRIHTRCFFLWLACERARKVSTVSFNSTRVELRFNQSLITTRPPRKLQRAVEPLIALVARLVGANSHVLRLGAGTTAPPRSQTSIGGSQGTPQAQAPRLQTLDGQPGRSPSIVSSRQQSLGARARLWAGWAVAAPSAMPLG